MQLSKKQTDAVHAKENAIVSAGAGSGKTRVLVERCLEQVLEKGVSLENILVITFMNDAAAEMKNRLRHGITSVLNELLKTETSTKPQEEQKQARLDELENQLAQLEEASISTIHSFCLKLLRENFDLLAPLEGNPGRRMRVMDDAATYRLKKKAFALLMRKHYREDKFNPPSTPEDTLQRVVPYLRNFLGNNENSLREILFYLYDCIQSLDNPRQWLSLQDELLQKETPEHWLKFLFETDEEKNSLLTQFLRPIRNKILGKDAGQETVNLLNNVLENPTWSNQETLLNILQDFYIQDSEKKSKNNKSEPSKKYLGSGMGGKTGKLSLLLSCYPTRNDDWNKCRKPITLLLSLLREFESEFNRQKKSYGGLTYDDQLQYTLHLLRDSETGEPTPLALSLRERYKLIFVDEFQDTNKIQTAIISAISNRNSFLVGDVKQSIYRFRMADPQIFRNYEHNASAKKDGWQLYPLNENYRSQPEIIHFINLLFQDLMQKSVGGVQFDENAYLTPCVPSVHSETPRVQFLWNVVEKGSDSQENSEDESSSSEDLSNVEREAILLAEHLLQMKSTVQVIDRSNSSPTAMRPMEYSDVTLLCRSGLTSIAPIYIREFEKRGIPISAPGIDLFDCVEILDLLNLLNLFDNPLQDFPLMGLLRSPFVGVTPNEFVLLRIAFPDDTFYSAVNRAITQPAQPPLPEELLQKLNTFHQRFQRWRTRLRLLPLSQLLEEILEETAYEASFSLLPFPEQKLKNVRHFLSILENFDPLHRQGVRRFLDHVQSLKESSSKDNPSADSSCGTNAVQIRTVHKSKGLQFPIVFLVGVSKRFNDQFMENGVGWDPKLGLTLKASWMVQDTPAQKQTLGCWLASTRSKSENHGEELRILYVGLTRACEYLTLCGTFEVDAQKTETASSSGRASKKKDKPKEISPFSYNETMATASSYKDWLIPWLKLHEKEEKDKKLLFEEDRPAAPEIVATFSATDSSPFSIGLKFLSAQDSAEVSTPEQHSPALSTEALQELKAKLDWQYPYSSVVTVPAKNSVTGLKRDSEEWKLFHKSLRGHNTGSQDLQGAADRGTAYHRVMECLQMKSEFALTPPEPSFYKAEMERMREARLLTPEQFEQVQPEIICRFWQTEIGRRFLSRWSCVQRELPFTLKVSGRQLDAMGISTALQGTDETVIVQGVIDLLMRDDKEIWLLDYKTDSVTAQELPPRVDSYRPQIEFYALALNSIYRLPVTQKHLAFLMPASNVPLA